LIDFYLQDENKKHWAEIQRLAGLNTAEADKLITKYTLEGTRLSNSLGIFRTVEPADGTTITLNQFGQDIVLKKGDKLFVSFIHASKDKTVFPDPLEVKLDRPVESYVTHGEGQHQCLGKEINIIQNTYMIKILAKLRNLRRTPGDEGKLKYVEKAGGVKTYMNADWSKFGPYPTSECFPHLCRLFTA
jgi:cytochrome P450